MVELVFDSWALAFAVVGITSALIFARYRSNPAENFKQIKQNYDKIAKSQDDYIDELQATVRHYKAKAGNMERGPVLEGDISELDSVLPELFGSFEHLAPKWLKPFLGNKDTQKWLIDYAQKNPEKVQALVGKMVRKKGGKDEPNNTEAQADTLSV